MVNLLKNFIKVIEAIFMLLVPLVFFYWFISMIDLDSLKSIVTLLDQVFSKPVDFIKNYIDLQIEDRGLIIDFAAVILGFCLIGMSLMLAQLRNFIALLEFKYLDVLSRKEQKKLELEVKEKKDQEVQDLKDHKVIYFILKLKKYGTADAYLYNQDEDLFSESIVSGLINGAAEQAAREYSGEKYSEFKAEDGSYRYVFSETKKAIEYAKYLKGRVIEINKEVLDHSLKVYYTIGCHCNYDHSTAKDDLFITSKILGLSGENEVTVSDVFKDKYEAEQLQENIDFAPRGSYLFDSKGMCSINNDELEVFKIKID